MGGTGGRGVQSIEVGGRLLSVLATQAGPMMLRDLAAAAALVPAQAHAYLISLRKIGLVERTPGSALYQLGPFALRLGLARMHVSDPIRLASEGLDALALELEMQVVISAWGGKGATVILLRDGPYEVPSNLQPGRIVPLLASTEGRVFIAFGPPETQEVLRRELAADAADGRPAPTLGDMEAGATRTRERGYVTTRDRPVPGISGICLPVFGADGQLEMAISALGRSDLVEIGPGSPQLAALRRFVDHLSVRIGVPPADAGKPGAAPPRTTGSVAGA